MDEKLANSYSFSIVRDSLTDLMPKFGIKTTVRSNVTIIPFVHPFILDY